MLINTESLSNCWNVLGGISALFTVIITILLTIRLYILCYGFIYGITKKPQNDKPHLKSFPLYTIIVPMFMESPKDINSIRKNIEKIEYPNLEIIYLIEEIDILSCLFFQTAQLRGVERYLKVPRIFPFTKPKACNYGLQVAKGEYIVIYDVEDSPHPLQIHKAVEVFENSQTDCIQFCLNFVHSGTVLSAWQRIDYLFWYKALLLFLQKIDAPIPLGGTSNHFRVSKLRSIGGWNSYNVTEDAELGIRLYGEKNKIVYIDDYPTNEKTIENANNLINQRVRWCKGHLLTFFHFVFGKYKNKSAKSIFWVWFVLGYNPTIYLLSILMFFVQSQTVDSIMVIHILNILIFMINPLLHLIAFKDCRKRKMIIPTLIIPVYSFFYIIPVFKAILESIGKPYVWYKTAR